MAFSDRASALEWNPLRPVEANPFNLDGQINPDVRDTWVGSERAAAEIGVGRTQAWRLACKWAEMQEQNIQPPVRVIVMGTQERPEYKYCLQDLVKYASERRLRKAKNRLRQAQRGLRAVLPLLQNHPTLLTDFVKSQGGRATRRQQRRDERR